MRTLMMKENNVVSSVMKVTEQDRAPVASSSFTTATVPGNGSSFAPGKIIIILHRVFYKYLYDG